MPKHSIIVTKDEFLEAKVKYLRAISKLPLGLQEAIPDFEKYLSPANYTNFSTDDIELSITGTQRYKVLDNPYVVTLLASYAARRTKSI